jgi:hypothetical protein
LSGKDDGKEFMVEKRHIILVIDELGEKIFCCFCQIEWFISPSFNATSSPSFIWILPHIQFHSSIHSFIYPNFIPFLINGSTGKSKIEKEECPD